MKAQCTALQLRSWFLSGSLLRIHLHRPSRLVLPASPAEGAPLLGLRPQPLCDALQMKGVPADSPHYRAVIAWILPCIDNPSWSDVNLTSIERCDSRDWRSPVFGSRYHSMTCGQRTAACLLLLRQRSLILTVRRAPIKRHPANAADIVSRIPCPCGDCMPILDLHIPGHSSCPWNKCMILMPVPSHYSNADRQ